jgi:phosphoribosylglycinamide formyltransferase-1
VSVPQKPRLAILISGRGSNFAAIHEAVSRGELVAEIVAVISNRPDAAGLEHAREWGYAAFAVDHKAFPSREEHERAVLALLRERGAEWIALAGYMRKLTATFIEPYRGRIVNIHPSLLPAFPGVDAQRQAYEHGVKVTGCTVHLVDETLDGGAIVVQRAVEVRDSDTVETLAARILEQEHRAYVDALRRLLGGGWRADGRRIVAAR